MSPRTTSQHLELLCVLCSGGEPDENGASTICALCSIGETTQVAEAVPAPARIRRRRTTSPEMLCIVCSGGQKDAAGAHTVCVLCAEGQDLPAAA